MKNLFKKAVSLTVALSAVAALSVSAFADYTVEQADTEVKVTVGATLDSVQVNTNAEAGNAYATAGNGQYAVAVVPANFTGSEQNADELIYYVNQADQTAIVTILNNMLLKGALTVGTDYEVRIGTDVTGVDVTTIDFKVVEKAETPTTTTVTFVMGDVNKANGVTSADANYILAYLGGSTASVGGDYAIDEKITDVNNVEYIFGDVNGANGVTSADANYILAYLGGSTASVGGKVSIDSELQITVPVK